MVENLSEFADDPPPPLPLSLLIDVTSLQARADLDREDVDVAGVYRVDLDFDTAEHQTLAKRASMALDVFHSSVAIAVLDDFCITVINPQDRAQVDQDPEHEDYSESDSGAAYKMRDVPFQAGRHQVNLTKEQACDSNVWSATVRVC